MGPVDGLRFPGGGDTLRSTMWVLEGGTHSFS